MKGTVLPRRSVPGFPRRWPSPDAELVGLRVWFEAALAPEVMRLTSVPKAALENIYEYAQWVDGHLPETANQELASLAAGVGLAIRRLEAMHAEGRDGWALGLDDAVADAERTAGRCEALAQTRDDASRPARSAKDKRAKSLQQTILGMADSYRDRGFSMSGAATRIAIKLAESEEWSGARGTTEDTIRKLLSREFGAGGWRPKK